MARDISIEYAHIYTNQRISDEHRTSVQILHEITGSLAQAGKSTSLVVMVDDYSFPDQTFNYEKFTAWLADQGFRPDLLIRESQLIPLCDQVIGIMKNEELKTQITDYITTKKYPCSLFIAAWYLLRLGKLKSPLMSNELYASKLINILPESFKPFEDKGLEIIAATDFKDVIDSIEYRFLPGRLIA